VLLLAASNLCVWGVDACQVVPVSRGTRVACWLENILSACHPGEGVDRSLDPFAFCFGIFDLSLVCGNGCQPPNT